MKKLTLKEAKSIVLAEKAHWEKFNSDMSIGAIGACANIYATLCGIRVPWHPNPVPENSPVVPDHGRELET